MSMNDNVLNVRFRFLRPEELILLANVRLKEYENEMSEGRSNKLKTDLEDIFNEMQHRGINFKCLADGSITPIDSDHEGGVDIDLD